VNSISDINFLTLLF